jgi:multidrug efflux pump subunit AcrA (membrane-fusion protein)
VLSKFPGYIEKILVHAGDSVIAGQTLIIIRNEVGSFNVSLAENNYQLATNNADDNGTLLKSILQDIVAAKSKYELDSVNFIRQEGLYRDNATSRLNLDHAKTQFELSKASYFKNRETYYNKRQQLNIERQNAFNQLQAAKASHGDYELLAAISGKVYDVIPNVGDLVGSQSVLMEIGDHDQFEVELAIDETDISSIQLNQEVVYVIDAYRDSIFTGRITEIFPRVNPLSKTLRVKASFDSSLKLKLFSSMSAEANIRISDRKNVLVIPREYITDGNKVKVKGEKDFREVKKGVEDLEFVEVRDGIDESTVLVRP